MAKAGISWRNTAKADKYDLLNVKGVWQNMAKSGIVWQKLTKEA